MGMVGGEVGALGYADQFVDWPPILVRALRISTRE